MSNSSKPTWQAILRTNFTNWESLADFLELTEEQRLQISNRREFPLNLPRRLANKISKKTLDDPILRQFLPTFAEHIKLPGFSKDPVGDQASRQSPKLLHKYSGRVLLVATSACPMHCRYCFRQNFDYASQQKGFDAELDYIRQDSTIREVILSGGDPLSLSNQILADLLQRLAAIPHLQRLRFHTRFPLGIPERLDDEFFEILARFPLQIWFVIHANHPKEFDDEIFTVLHRLKCLGAVILCQSVLLKGVNDQRETLIDLCQTLVNHGILPYYLHQLDRTEGTGHFEVPEDQGYRLIKELSEQLPGFAVPKYVKEEEGQPSKSALHLKSNACNQ